MKHAWIAEWGRNQDLIKELEERKQKVREKYKEAMSKYDIAHKRKLTRDERKELCLISKATYYRYKKILDNLEKGIFPQTKRPHNLRQPKLYQRIDEAIIEIRKTNDEVYGEKKIAHILKNDYKIFVGHTTVGKRIKDLKARGKIEDSRSANRIKRKRVFKGHAQRWTYDMRKDGHKIGQMIQVDHMSVKVGAIYCKHFSAIDPATKILHSKATSHATSHAAKRFLKELVKAFPYPIKSIQVDGGSEFMGEFEEGCKELGIKLYVLPPQKPKYNGCVERSNRVFREEFYARQDLCATSMAEINEEIGKYLAKYNNKRPHASLKMKTPSEYAKMIMEAL